MLKVDNLYVNYGMIEALHGISFNISKGEIVALIGSNGAGKTTTLHAISRLINASKGEISLDDKNLLKMSADKVVKAGIAQVPERRRVFAELTVEDNLMLGAYTRKDKEGIAKDLEQQMLAMGRALMAKPDILLMDEPSMGLSPLLVKEIFSIIKKINETGVTILLVEQNAKLALEIADRAYVLETGNIALEGTGKELLNSESIRKAYLGG